MSDVQDQRSGAVTRVEIIDAVGTAFAGSAATKQQLLTAAVQYESRSEVLALLNRLPDRSFGHVRDLWVHLPDVPVGD